MEQQISSRHFAVKLKRPVGVFIGYIVGFLTAFYQEMGVY